MKITRKQMARIAKIAKLSNCTVQHWLDGVINSAIYADEGHFAEMAERESAAKAVDRSQFSRLAGELRNLSSPAIDQLVRVVADARMQGRAEASRVR